jgi:hypothetical protein
MNTFKWITTNLYTLDVNTNNGYVVTAVYDVIATDGKYFASITNVSQFSIKENDPNFVIYDDLTNDIIIEWVKTQLGPDGVIAIENSLNLKIQSQNNPPKTPVNTPLPFELK